MMEYNAAKFKALIQYIVYTADKSIIGKTKLNKVLWFSEREMFLQYGRGITGETYIKKDHGPVPLHMIEASNELEAEKKIVVRPGLRRYPTKDYVSLAKPDISCFAPEEIDIVRSQLQWIEPLTANQVSNISHDWAWQTADDDEEIPLATGLLGAPIKPSASDIAWAQQYV